MNIIINDRPIGRKQVRFPKSKKKRIRKKWAKKESNYKPQFIEGFLVLGGYHICTSRTFDRLKRSTQH